MNDAAPSRANGKPNLLLWNDGPILWKLSPVESKTSEDQRMASSTTMNPGCKRDSCVFLGVRGDTSPNRSTRFIYGPLVACRARAVRRVTNGKNAKEGYEIQPFRRKAY